MHYLLDSLFLLGHSVFSVVSAVLAIGLCFFDGVLTSGCVYRTDESKGREALIVRKLKFLEECEGWGVRR
jgi:hypothetical protein